jgi:hypothetical protein
LYVFHVKLTVSNQAQYSNHNAQPIESILKANLDFILSKTGSQSPLGGFLI